LRQATAVTALPVAMIQPTCETSLVVGAAWLLESCGSTAGLAAIALSPITMPADPKHRMTSLPTAKALAKKHFAINRQPSPPDGGCDCLLSKTGGSAQSGYEICFAGRKALPGPVCRFERVQISEAMPTAEQFIPAITVAEAKQLLLSR
jgi:hypothetical protein